MREGEGGGGTDSDNHFHALALLLPVLLFLCIILGLTMPDQSVTFTLKMFTFPPIHMHNNLY